jgi:hypothetical protein
MAKIVVGLPSLTQPLLLYPSLGPAMLEQHRRKITLTINNKLKPEGVLITIPFSTAKNIQSIKT